MTNIKTISASEEKKLQEIQNLTLKKLENTNINPIKLNENEILEIENNLKDTNNFQQLGEKITQPINNIIEKVSKIIEEDPIMDVSNELKQINEEVQSVYKQIINDDGAIMKLLKSLPGIGNIANTIDKKLDEAKFNIQAISGKIQTIFSGFDQSYKSLNKSIQMQKEFLQGLEENIGKVKAYKDYLSKKLEEFKAKLSTLQDEYEIQKYNFFIKNMEYFLNNLNVLLGNLELARKRLLIRLDSAVKLALAMNSSRPIFQTLLSVAILETSGQKALDASLTAVTTMGKTIDKLSSDLTDKTIESSRKTEEITSKPILDTKVFIENVEKLKNHFDTISQYRQQLEKEAELERAEFEKATKTLKNLKEIKVEDIQNLEDTINK